MSPANSIGSASEGVGDWLCSKVVQNGGVALQSCESSVQRLDGAKHSVVYPITLCDHGFGSHAVETGATMTKIWDSASGLNSGLVS